MSTCLSCKQGGCAPFIKYCKSCYDKLNCPERQCKTCGSGFFLRFSRNPALREKQLFWFDCADCHKKKMHPVSVSVEKRKHEDLEDGEIILPNPPPPFELANYFEIFQANPEKFFQTFHNLLERVERLEKCFFDFNK
jgi:hypothetical protein